MKLSGTEIGEIIKEVAKKDEGLAEIIEKLFRCLEQNLENMRKNRDELFHEHLLSPATLRDIKPKDIFDCFVEGRDIFMFPSQNGNICPCAKYFVGLAFGGWSSNKNGFAGAASVANEYWLSCYNENKGTVIFTDAWDTSGFKNTYESLFDSYSNGCPSPKGTSVKHTICVIFIGRNRISYEYLS
jgi:hypothetical protein